MQSPPRVAKAASSRARAARACLRCSQRKVRCDAAEHGLPCSRCKLDAFPTCALTTSRRGIYPRKKQLPESEARDTIIADSGLPSGRSRHLAITETDYSVCHDTESRRANANISLTFTDHNIGADNAFLTGGDSSNGPTCAAAAHTFPPPTPASSTSTKLNSTVTTSTDRDSLAAMFEDFLEKQGHTHDGAASKLGVVFFSESSPLTFALDELQRPAQASLYDPGLSNKDDVRQRNAHPSHMSSDDLAWLKAKGSFDVPSREVLEALITAFLDRFFQLYSIVDRDSFVQLHEQQKLPWILLHAGCFIGATFCDISVIHQAGLKSRWHMRHLYYDKAKVLFDVGYETNRVTLLQTVLMLSFWGPQMRSYWNPCSWIGFGATIAESLGINRSNSSTRVDSRTKGLLRRLWWTLVVRDAYCAALLGRPFRINISQCDTDLLSMSDFTHNTACTGDGSHQDCHKHCLYQIEIVKLSLILRKVVELRFGPSSNPTTIDELHSMSNEWQTGLPLELDWSRSNDTSKDVLSSSLRIIFNHHLIFIHMGKPSTADDLGAGVDVNSTSFKIAESAAQSISTTALTLMTNSMVGLMPHEIFPGFFIAGIVFYRRSRQSQEGFAQLYRAALDTCRMVMNEARERWDPALWAMKIFDFLLSGTSNNVKPSTPAAVWQSEPTANDRSVFEEQHASQNNVVSSLQSEYNDLDSINFDPFHSLDMDSAFNDIMLMPSYFGGELDV